jgi:Raf kinase inhibitor-like YbhB/YbcL family protein
MLSCKPRLGCKPTLGRKSRTRAHWPVRSRWLRLVSLAGVVPLATGCGLLGGLSGSGGVAPQSMTVTSPDFRNGAKLPLPYTCHGKGFSPPLYWSGSLSQQAKSFAVVVDSGEAPITPYVYWIVFDISPSTSDIAQNRLPTGARQAENSAGTARYDPPCPQRDNEVHTYRLTVYALNARLKLPNGAGLRTTWSAIARHVIGVGRLTVRSRMVSGQSH